MQRLNMLLPPGPAANTLHCLKDEEQFAGLCFLEKVGILMHLGSSTLVLDF